MVKLLGGFNLSHTLIHFALQSIFLRTVVYNSIAKSLVGYLGSLLSITKCSKATKTKTQW